MKKRLLLLSVVLSTFFCWSQNNKILEVIYVKGYKNHNDTTNIAPKILKTLEYSLICNSNESRFEYIPSLESDDDNTNTRYINRGGGKGIYYKNLNSKEKLWQIDAFGEDFLVQLDFDRINWVLLKNETKNILGYDCFKAIGSYKEYSPMRKKTITHKLEAWYAPSLPIPFGPSGFDGLPGLVLETNRNSFYLIAKEVNMLEEEKKIEKITKGKKVTLEEFNKLLNKGFENFTQKN